jgi:hypothetical protein
MFVVMKYDDGTRYPLGVLMDGMLYHRTRRTLRHAEGPVALDAGLVTFLQANGIAKVDFRYEYERPIYTFDLTRIGNYPVKETIVLSRPNEFRLRHFIPWDEWKPIAEPYTCPIPKDTDEITIDERGTLLSIGIDTRSEAA